ncbi:MAG: dihydrofolate reductase, partial [Pseudomonadota bacterium]
MKYKPKLCLIVARGRNGVIGREGALPWRLRDDLS